MMRNLITFGRFLVKFCQMTFEKCSKLLVHNIFEGIYQNFDLFLAKCSNFTISKVEWVEIIKILIISLSSLMTMTRLILAGLILIYFIKISIKSTS